MNSRKPVEDRLSHPLLHRIAHLTWRVTRGMTLGVRVVALNAAGDVYLVRHSYTPGWHLPGGGVEPGETALQALEREMLEEGRLVFSDAPALHGVFFNSRVSNRDHVMVYVARGVTQTSVRAPDREIIDGGFHAPDALPPETTRATRERIREALEGATPSHLW